MVPMLSADECLTDFFRDRRRGAVHERLQRISRVEGVLRRRVEQSADLVLTEEEQTLLACEREFGPFGAVARVMPCDGLLLALELHVEQLRMQTMPVADRRDELDLSGALVRHLVRELKHLDIAPAVQRLMASLREQTADLERDAARSERRRLRFWGARTA